MTNERRLEKLTDFMRRLQRRLRLSTQADMARALGMKESTYKHRLRCPEEMRMCEITQLAVVARRAEMEEELWSDVLAR